MQDTDGTAAVSWSADRIDLFWVDAGGALVHLAYANGTWAEPESLGGTLTSSPAATAWAADQLQVFAIFPDNALWNRFWDGISWHPWESLGPERMQLAELLFARGQLEEALRVASQLDATEPTTYPLYQRPSLALRLRIAEAMNNPRLSATYRRRLAALKWSG